MGEAKTKICVIGIWHQGAVAAACLADLGFQIVGVDQDQTRIQNLKMGKAPLFEPGLDDLLMKGVISGNLSFTNSLVEGLSGSQNVLIMFDTLVDENDDVDLTDIFATIREMTPYLLSETLLVISSQVPIGTCDRITKIIQDTNPHSNFEIAYFPENLRLGQAISRFMHPPMPVLGADSSETFERAEKLLSVLSESWMHVNLRTAEMTKHALNAFLAVSICFANELGNLCDLVGADGMQIAKALRIEPRIGPKAMLFPGLGFSGGTLARDMRTLQNIGDIFETETFLIDGAWKSNQLQNSLVAIKLQKIFGSLIGLNVGVLGLTYKPDTSTLRRSASIEIIKSLVALGAHVRAFDPKADRQELEKYSEFETCSDAYSVADGSDVLIMITPWPEFKVLDFQKIYSLMKQPVLFDTQNLLNVSLISKMGFVYYGIGRGITTIKDFEVRE